MRKRLCSVNVRHIAEYFAWFLVLRL